MGFREALRSLVFGPDLDRRDPRSLEQRQWALSVPAWQLDKPVWPARTTHAYRTQGYEALPVVYACVNARAQAISAATVRVYRERPDGAQEDLPQHPVRLLLRAPNRRMSEAEFLLQTLICMDVGGFALIEKVRASRGNIVELWHLRPDWAKPIYRADGRVDWEYRVPGRDVQTIRDDDVIAVPGGATLDFSVTGMSPIAVALREVGIENAATDFLKTYFDSGGAPRYAITTPQQITDQAKADLLRAQFGQVHQGVQNWNRVAILAGGADLKPISDTLQDMAYPELRKMTEANICKVFGVPPVIIGAQVGLEAATYSNYELARRTFYQDTIVPLWSRIDGALTRSLLPELEVDSAVSLEFDTSGIPALQEDVTPAWTRAQQALAAGLITLNQAQAEIGEDGFGGDGDVLYLPSLATVTRPADLTALADETAKPPEPVPPQLLPNGPTGPTGPNDGATGVTGPTGVTGGANAAAALEAHALRVGGEWIALDAPIHRLPANVRSVSAAINKGQITRLANKHAPPLAAFFRDQGERLAAAAKRAEGPHETRDVAGLLNYDWDADRQALEDVLRALYDNAGETAYARVANQLKVGVSWDMAHPYVRQVMHRVGHAADTIHATSVEAVQRIVIDATEQGTTMPDLARQLEQYFGGSNDRAMTVARTESRIAYDHAAVAAYKQSNVVAAAELMDNPNHGDYGGDADGETCASRNGLIVDLDDVEKHIDGTHPRCILAVAPVLYRPLGAAE